MQMFDMKVIKHVFLTALFSTDNRCTPTSTETRKKNMSGKEMRLFIRNVPEQ